MSKAIIIGLAVSFVVVVVAFYTVTEMLFRQDVELQNLKTYIQDQQQACIDFSLVK